MAPSPESTVAAQQLTAAERAATVASVWAEARYNFAYWDRVRADWDSGLVANLKLAAEPQSDLLFYRRLRRLLALLADGRAAVIAPPTLRSRIARPPLLVSSVERRPFILDYAENDEMRVARPPRLSEILAVQGVPAETWIRDSVLPEVCAATPADRWQRAAAWMLQGDKGTTLHLLIRVPGGEPRGLSVTRSLSLNDRWPLDPPAFATESLPGGIAVVRIASLGDEEVERHGRTGGRPAGRVPRRRSGPHHRGADGRESGRRRHVRTPEELGRAILGHAPRGSRRHGVRRCRREASSRRDTDGERPARGKRAGVGEGARIPQGRPSAALVLQTLPEESHDRLPRAVRDFRLFTGAQETVADAGIHGIAVALVVRADRRVHVGQAGVDARVVLGVDTESLGADARDGQGVGTRSEAHNERAEGRVVGGVTEALAAAPAETNDAHPVAPGRLDPLDVRQGRVEILRDRVGVEPRDEFAGVDQ